MYMLVNWIEVKNIKMNIYILWIGNQIERKSYAGDYEFGVEFYDDTVTLHRIHNPSNNFWNRFQILSFKYFVCFDWKCFVCFDWKCFVCFDWKCLFVVACTYMLTFSYRLQCINIFPYWNHFWNNFLVYHCIYYWVKRSNIVTRMDIHHILWMGG